MANLPVPKYRVAANSLNHVYRYGGQSAVRTSRSRPELYLATSLDATPAESAYYRGDVHRPAQTASLMLAVSRVAMSRFYFPPAMVARLIREADPVVTVADKRIRFESFSQCCGVYARLDLLEESLPGEVARHGTTNVDFNAPMRAALAKVRSGERIGLQVGRDELRLEHDGGDVVERKVALPRRWLKGFVESQSYAARLTRRFSVDGPRARRFLASLPGTTRAGDVAFLHPGSGVPRLGRLAQASAVPIAGPARLRILRDLARNATALNVYACDESRASGWELDLPGARFFLLASPDVSRGFSGEGQVLAALAGGTAAPISRVRAALAWQASIPAADMAERIGAPAAQIDAALAALGSQGLVGYDPREQRWFHRELPFALAEALDTHPRLTAARALVDQERVTLRSDRPGRIDASVAGSGVDHRVRETAGGLRCTCKWHARHGGERGPCKHILAVEILTRRPTAEGPDGDGRA